MLRLSVLQIGIIQATAAAECSRRRRHRRRRRCASTWGGEGWPGMAQCCWAQLALLLLLGVAAGGSGVLGAHWAHHADLDHNYALFWTPADHDITFEVQVRSLGYVGFGFSADGQMAGADMVVGWVRDNQVFFQDRFAADRAEPQVDASQDYELLLGYENGTHTVLRFRRRYDTCDDRDMTISNDTMRVLWSYHESDPAGGGGAGSLPYHGPTTRGTRSLYLMQNPGSKPHQAHDLLTWDITNTQVTLPALEDTLYWCRIFKVPTIRQKHHIIRYEPVHEAGNSQYIHHVILYECQGGNVGELEELSRDKGQPCYQPNMPLSVCNTVVITWNQGSEGFSFPPEAGYPLDPNSGPKYYMMETHYNNPAQDVAITDSSGIRIYYTKSLRRHDAGILSVGLDPNWRHIIPPGQPQVVSEGHCIADCTRQTIPPRGINIFSVILHSHLIGRKIRLRQIRDGEELPPIAVDNNYDFSYQENRRLTKPAQVLPGDHLIAECVYNSVDRTTITLGGQTTREEKCLVYGLYYPRINLSLCHSLPSLPTVLHSLGIQELWPESNPVAIKSPPELADMTLETRLVSYDWENNFHSFQEVTHQGSFKPLCWMKLPHLVMDTENLESFYPNITKPYKERSTCTNNRWKKPRRRKKPEDGEQDDSGDGGENLTSDKNKAFNNVGIQESSRLNHSEISQSSALLMLLAWSAILCFR